MKNEYNCLYCIIHLIFALVLYMQVGKAENRIASMKIRRENLNEWGLSTETVFDTALLNTYFISPPRIYLLQIFQFQFDINS